MSLTSHCLCQREVQAHHSKRWRRWVAGDSDFHSHCLEWRKVRVCGSLLPSFVLRSSQLRATQLVAAALSRPPLCVSCLLQAHNPHIAPERVDSSELQCSRGMCVCSYLIPTLPLYLLTSPTASFLSSLLFSFYHLPTPSISITRLSRQPDYFCKHTRRLLSGRLRIPLSANGGPARRAFRGASQIAIQVPLYPTLGLSRTPARIKTTVRAQSKHPSRTLLFKDSQSQHHLRGLGIGLCPGARLPTVALNHTKYIPLFTTRPPPLLLSNNSFRLPLTHRPGSGPLLEIDLHCCGIP